MLIKPSLPVPVDVKFARRSADTYGMKLLAIAVASLVLIAPASAGNSAATTATAHKIAVVFYTMVSKQVEYDASLWAQRDVLREKRIEARLQKQAAQRGNRLVPLEAAA